MRHLILLPSIMALGLVATFAVVPTFRGNPQSHIVHQAKCRHFTAKGSREIFFSMAEARKSGYRPCRVCEPK